jgi:hypothetical protein
MTPDNVELERHYEQFHQEHLRLRGEWLDALAIQPATGVPTKKRELRRFQRLASISTWKRFAGLAAGALVVAVASLIAFKVFTPALTYANVLARVERVRSVTYTKTMVQPILPEGQTRIRILVLDRYLERQEHFGPDGTIAGIFIVDFQTGAQVMLYPLEKRFEILSRQRLILPDGSQQIKEVKPAPSADIYKSIQAIPPDAKPVFPEREIDSRKVVGFYCEESVGVYLWKNTYWIDVKTMLPVRIEKEGYSKNGKWLSTKWVWSDFVFDEELDRSLFSTQAPAGYKVEQGEVQGFQMPMQESKNKLRN